MPYNFFGEAVHAVLPYLKRRLEKGRRGLPDYDKFLKNFMYIYREYSHKIKGTKAFKLTLPEREWLQACWWYILELAAEADAVIVEPTTLNGTCPDLLLLHHGCVYIVDIKTLERFGGLAKMSSSSRSKLVKQIRQNAAEARFEMGYNVEIFGYGLVFETAEDAPFDPIWLPIYPSPRTP